MRVVLAMLLLVAGCKAPSLPLSNATGESITRAQVRGDSAQAHVRAALPGALPPAKVHLETAAGELDSQRDDLSDAKTADQAKDKYIAEQTKRYGTLEGRWYVRWGRRIQVVLITISSLWLVLGIVGAALGPASTIGVLLFRNLPFASAFNWLRNIIHPDKRLAPVVVNASTSEPVCIIGPAK